MPARWQALLEQHGVDLVEVDHHTVVEVLANGEVDSIPFHFYFLDSLVAPYYAQYSTAEPYQHQH